MSHWIYTVYQNFNIFSIFNDGRIITNIYTSLAFHRYIYMVIKSCRWSALQSRWWWSPIKAALPLSSCIRLLSGCKQIYLYVRTYIFLSWEKHTLKWGQKSREHACSSKYCRNPGCIRWVQDLSRGFMSTVNDNLRRQGRGIIFVAQNNIQKWQMIETYNNSDLKDIKENKF